MDYTISFTPSQVIAMILAICAGISCVSGAITVIAGWINKTKAPEKKQDERITEIEKRLSRYEEAMMNDNRRLEILEDGNRITQRAILALLSHGIDGNNIEEMKNAKNELQEFLIKR